MIQTFTDGTRVVDGMQLTGNLASAKKLCKWLGISKWHSEVIVGTGQYGVRIPKMLNPDEPLVRPKEWVISTDRITIEILSAADMKQHYERL